MQPFQKFFRGVMFACLILVLAFAGTQFYAKYKAAEKQLNKVYVEKTLLYNDDGNGFTVIAHRGASGYRPENTMSAFRYAVELNAEMIELDVILSSDGVPMVFHDATLDRCTDGEGLFVDFTYDELRKLDAGSWFDTAYEGEPIPTLEEVLAFTKDKISVNVEIKTESVTDELNGGVEEKCLDLVKKYDMLDHVIFSSFDYRAIEHLEKLDPEATTAILYNSDLSDKDETPSDITAKYNADMFNCWWKELNDEWITDLQDHAIPFNVYTVNDADKMEEIIAKGAAGIFSDKADVLLEVSKKVLPKK